MAAIWVISLVNILDKTYDTYFAGFSNFSILINSINIIIILFIPADFPVYYQCALVCSVQALNILICFNKVQQSRPFACDITSLLLNSNHKCEINLYCILYFIKLTNICHDFIVNPAPLPT